MDLIDSWLRPVVRIAWRTSVWCVVWAHLAPWVALAALGVVLRTTIGAAQGFHAGRAAAVSNLPCPRGHRSELHGIFECRCGALFAGWAFENCPICHEGCGYVTCEHCGLAVKNPIVQALEPRRWTP